ncbi:putative transcription factor NAM family [Arabidopsis thaliana]
MENPVGLRFRPTDKEIVVDYLRPKNSDRDTSHVDRVISTVTIRSFDPWELPCQSRIKLKDESWCFFSPKENKYGRGDQQIRKTKSGYWKITGKPKPILRNRQEIGEKKVLMFYMSKELGGFKSDWVMHEYHAFSPTQMMMTYTICKVMFKGDVREISSSSASSYGSEIEQSRDSLIPLLVNDSEEEAQIEDAIPIEEWETWLTDDSFGSSDQINLVSLTQEVSQALITSIDTPEKIKSPYDDAQGTGAGGQKLGQETREKKRAGFFHRMIQIFVKKIHLCSSISRT